MTTVEELNYILNSAKQMTKLLDNFEVVEHPDDDSQYKKIAKYSIVNTRTTMYVHLPCAAIEIKGWIEGVLFILRRI